jgi:hypothetical protein
MKPLLLLILIFLASCENPKPYLETKEVQTDSGILVIKVENGKYTDTLGIVRKDSIPSTNTLKR